MNTTRLRGPGAGGNEANSGGRSSPQRHKGHRDRHKGKRIIVLFVVFLYLYGEPRARPTSSAFPLRPLLVIKAPAGATRRILGNRSFPYGSSQPGRRPDFRSSCRTTRAEAWGSKSGTEAPDRTVGRTAEKELPPWRRTLERRPGKPRPTPPRGRRDDRTGGPRHASAAAALGTRLGAAQADPRRRRPPYGRGVRLAMVAFSVAPLVNNLRGTPEQGLRPLVRDRPGVPPRRPRSTRTTTGPFPFMYPPSCAALLALAEPRAARRGRSGACSRRTRRPGAVRRPVGPPGDRPGAWPAPACCTWCRRSR